MPVYLDHAASTPMRGEVRELLLAALAESGNPSSVHGFGQRAKLRLEEARDRIAGALGCDRAEVIFTSGGTEANNLAVFGLFEARNKSGERPIILCLGTEHHAVLEAAEFLESERGAEVHLIPVNTSGQPDLVWLSEALEVFGDRVALVSAILANNETGTVLDISAVTAVCKRLQIPVHSDAVAAVGHCQINFSESGLSTMALTGHKIGGPVGIGALIVGRSVALKQQLRGGSQERNLRPGTQDVAGAEALALAVELSVAELAQNRAHWEALRGRLIAGVVAAVPDAVLVGESADSPVGVRLSNIVDVVFPGCAGDSLLFMLDSAGVAISNGSACSAGVTSASHVLVALGYSNRDAASCVRVSFGRETTGADIDAFLAALPSAHAKAKLAGFTAL